MTQPTDKLYKIRHRETGLYSTGGQYPSWTRAGKTWSKLGTLRSHLAQHLGSDWHRGTDMSAWQVVEIEVREVAEHDVHAILSPQQMMRLLTKNHTKSTT